MLANDVHAHQSSVDTLNDAGRELIEAERGSVEASTTQDKLQQLNKQWRDLLQKAADRQHELEESLRDAQGKTKKITIKSIFFIKLLFFQHLLPKFKIYSDGLAMLMASLVLVNQLEGSQKRLQNNWSGSWRSTMNWRKIVQR